MRITEVTSQTAVVCLMLGSRSYPASFRRPAAKELGFGVLYPELALANLAMRLCGIQSTSIDVPVSSISQATIKLSITIAIQHNLSSKMSWLGKKFPAPVG